MLPFALPTRRERRLSDDRIHAILRAGADPHVHAADVCGQHGITIPEYCVLKKKYGALSLDALRAARSREARRRRHLLTATGAVVALAAVASVGFFVAASSAGASAHIEAATAAGHPLPARSTTPQARVVPTDRAARTSETPVPAGAATTAHVAAGPVPRPAAEHPPVEAPPDEGYAVQVAAVPDLESARGVVERLAAEGFAAYVRPGPAGAGTVIRVRVGPFPTRRQATLTLRDLVRAGHANAWLTR